MILIGEWSSFREIIVQDLTKLYVEDSANISMFVTLKVRKYSMDNGINSKFDTTVFDLEN